MYLLADFVYPLLLGVLSVGLGLLLERAADVRLPAALVPPAGFALLVGISQLITKFSALARFTAPLLVVLALAGLLLGRERLLVAIRRPGPEALPAVLVGVATYAVYAAPLILSFHVGWTAYGIDTTSAIHWLGADQLAHHGYDFANPSQSSAASIAYGYYSAAYPSGGVTALGTTAQLVGVSLPWLYGPFLAVVAAMLGLTLYGLLRFVLASRALALVIAFLAAQPALLYGFALQGQIKEVLAALFVPLLAALVVVYARTLKTGPRAVLPLAAAGAAGMGATGAGFVAWFGPAALLALIALVRDGWPERRWRLWLGASAVFVVATAVLALPAVTDLRTYFQSVSRLVNIEVPLGSLVRPLDPVQAAGIWWSTDFRVSPTSHATFNVVVIGGLAAGVLLASEWAWRRRAWPLLVFAIVTVPGALVLAQKGTPWIDAKAMILLAPLLVTFGLLGGFAALAGTPLRVAGIILGTAIGLGVLYSNALMYHGTQMSPTARYEELARIGDRFAGQGPTLRPDFDDYALYFTRRMDPFGPGDSRVPTQFQLLSGAPGYGVSLRMDNFAPQYVETYPLVLIQRSPFESRPPANYRLAYSGHYYDVWRRGPGKVLAHLPGGSTWSASGDVSCTAVRKLARTAESSGDQLAVAEAPVQSIPVAGLPLPANWIVSPTDPQVDLTVGPGRLSRSLRVPAAGNYDLWLAGSFTRPVHVLIDGRTVGTLSDDIKYSGLAQEVGDVKLGAGAHTLEIDRGGGSLAPGNGTGGAIGPAALTPAPQLRHPVRQIDPKDYRQLCGTPVDWIESVQGVPADGS